MSALTEQFKQMLIAHWKFDVAPTAHSDDVPEADSREAFEVTLRASHECPRKRAEGRCNCAFND